MIKKIKRNSSEVTAFLLENDIKCNESYFYNTSLRKRMFFTVIGDDLVFSNNLECISKEYQLEVYSEAIDFYKTFGFVHAPYTVYKNTYVLAPFVTFELQDPSVHSFRLPKKPNGSEVSKSKLAEIVEKDLLDFFSSDSDKYSSLFSGGIDSSVLLALANKTSSVENAINCYMGSMGNETIKAKRMCDDSNIKFTGVKLPNDLTGYAESFLRTVGEPISDQIAVVMPALLDSAMPDKNLPLIDGQGADSLFSGLPHDKVCKLYLKYPSLVKTLRLLNWLPVWNNKNSSFGRKLYRLTKAINCLSQPTTAEMLISSLKESYADKDLKSNAVYNSMLSELNNLHSELKDFHLVIRYYFMFRILFAREMQKYIVCENNGWKFCLPFVEPKFVDKYFYVPPNYSIVNRNYKFPMLQIAHKYWPLAFKTSSTSPFQVEFTVGDSDVKQLSIDKLLGR